MTHLNSGNGEATESSARSRLALLVPPYIFIYSLAGLWLAIDGWLTGFSSALGLWDNVGEAPPFIFSMMFTMAGALLGSAILGIISFHRYFAIEKSFDSNHIWGYLFSPLLALIVGALFFALFNSGLVVLVGNSSEVTEPLSASLGYFSMGGIIGYNWDVFVKKLEELSRSLAPSESQ
ncbi:hypothetical protein [Vibrio coralliirubri]|uniref:hypothetical protein n=1 Tax=Vibrio coralliirubri TaxID=1516159 RepID=UPI0021C3C895|nr:hypothetical protein [Vibrio coralliirubri]